MAQRLGSPRASSVVIGSASLVLWEVEQSLSRELGSGPLSPSLLPIDQGSHLSLSYLRIGVTFGSGASSGACVPLLTSRPPWVKLGLYRVQLSAHLCNSPFPVHPGLEGKHVFVWSRGVQIGAERLSLFLPVFNLTQVH